MIRESTDKEGGKQVIGRGSDEGRGMRHDVSKTSGRGAGFAKMDGIKVPDRAHHDLKMDHAERAHGPFHKVGSKPSSRREDGKY